MRWRQQWRRRRCDRGGEQDGGNADGGDEGVVVRAEGLAGTARSSSQHDAATRTRPFTVQTAERREVCLANSLLWTALLARANRRVQRYASVNKAGPRRCDGLERSGSECYIDDIYCFSTPIRAGTTRSFGNWLAHRCAKESVLQDWQFVPHTNKLAAQCRRHTRDFPVCTTAYRWRSVPPRETRFSGLYHNKPVVQSHSTLNFK